MASAEYDPEPTVLKALWKDITGFWTSLSGFLGDQSLSCFLSLSAKAGLNLPPFEISCSWHSSLLVTHRTGQRNTFPRLHIYTGCIPWRSPCRGLTVLRKRRGYARSRPFIAISYPLVFIYPLYHQEQNIFILPRDFFPWLIIILKRDQKKLCYLENERGELVLVE